MRYSSFLPPICLFIALLLLISGFAILATEAPSESVPIHAARASGDELVESALVNQLTRRIWARRLLLAALFSGSVLMVLVSFLTMRGKS